MAIIKCPECGHQISDRAPICPSCGVKIAGQITKCPQCGEVYFKDLRQCPYCNFVNSAYSRASDYVPTQPQTNTTVPPSTTGEGCTAPKITKQPQKKSHKPVLIGLIIAIIICGVGFFFYHQAKNNQEKEAYEFALNSTDPIVLQDYLDRFKEAPTAHRDSIFAHLSALQSMDKEWTDALISNSKSAIEDYLENHPTSPYKAEALRKIDSLDWATVKQTNTLDAYQNYLQDHPNGTYVDMAKDGIKRINASTVQPDEKLMVSSLFRQFFQYVNNNDEDGLTSTVNSILASFLGKTDATKSDVATFLHKLYRDDVASMTWHLANDYKINKKEIGDDEYEYTVNFSADQSVKKVDDTVVKNHYRIKAKVNPDGKITEFNMTRIIR